mgnify:CR=1 FL=1
MPDRDGEQIWSPFIRPEGLTRKRGIVDDVLSSSLRLPVKRKQMPEAPMSR